MVIVLALPLTGLCCAIPAHRHMILRLPILLRYYNASTSQYPPIKPDSLRLATVSLAVARQWSGYTPAIICNNQQFRAEVLHRSLD